jgi:hypothetical protein
VDEAKELVSICKEYHIALRCELKRKELREDDVSRAAELAAYFTHCQLQPVHTALSLRSAMSIFFKLKNYATCANFCRRLLELNPGQKVGGCALVDAAGVAGRIAAAAARRLPNPRPPPPPTPPRPALAPQIALQARQVLAACEKTPTDTVQVCGRARTPPLRACSTAAGHVVPLLALLLAGGTGAVGGGGEGAAGAPAPLPPPNSRPAPLQVNYDARNPFDICSITFTPIYRGSKYAEDPYTSARFQASCAGQTSPLGDFVKIGSDASGLLISPTQVR